MHVTKINFTTEELQMNDNEKTLYWAKNPDDSGGLYKTDLYKIKKFITPTGEVRYYALKKEDEPLFMILPILTDREVAEMKEQVKSECDQRWSKILLQRITDACARVRADQRKFIKDLPWWTRLFNTF